MCKKAIICDDEFAGKSKADYKQLKQLLSKQYFSIRRPYGKITEDLQRIAVLCGTSNEDEIVNDPTGNRRIIPLPIKSVDWDAYEMVDKDMLWMELYEEWKRTGNNWMLSREEIKLLNMSTIENQQQANEEEAILMYFALPGTNGQHSDWMTNAEIRNYIAMHSSFKYLSPTKVGLALKKLGFEKVPKKLNGTVKIVYEVQKLKTFEDDEF
jgi:predicted P-loop ATPase